MSIYYLVTEGEPQARPFWSEPEENLLTLEEWLVSEAAKAPVTLEDDDDY